MTMTRTAHAVVIAVALLGVARPALAETKGEALFTKGKKLLEQGKYAEACSAFEASQRAEAMIVTLLNIGLCYEKWGKLATAYATYLEAQKQAEAADDDRAERIRERAGELEPKVPTLIIHAVAEAKPVDLIVRLDAKDLPLGELDKPHRLDPGEHVVEYGVGTSKRKRIQINLSAGDHEEVTLDKLASMGAGGPVEETLDEQPRDKLDAIPDPGRKRRLAGLVIGGTGLASLGLSTFLIVSARSDYRAARAAHCNAMNECDAAGLQQTHDARSRANIATVFFAIGTAAVAGGVVLYLTAPKPSREERQPDDADSDEGEEQEGRLRLTPVVTPDGATVVLAGSF